MTRQLNKTTLGEALCIFDFKSEDIITKKIIAKKFREFSLKFHRRGLFSNKDYPEKEADKKKFTKLVEAKGVLLRDFDSIVTIDEKGKPIKSVGSVFVDFLKTVDTKNIKNPFTTYRKGRTK